MNQYESNRSKCEADGYICDSSCLGCWSTGPRSCQICKSYKLDDMCLPSCEDGSVINGKHIYLNDTSTRECHYCHAECKSGCYGPVITFNFLFLLLFLSK
jgi:hypothetical protein